MTNWDYFRAGQRERRYQGAELLPLMIAIAFWTELQGTLADLWGAAIVGYICWRIWRGRSVETRRKLISGAAVCGRAVLRYGLWACVAALGFVALWVVLRAIHWAWSTPFPFGS